MQYNFYLAHSGGREEREGIFLRVATLKRIIMELKPERRAYRKKEIIRKRKSVLIFDF